MFPSSTQKGPAWRADDWRPAGEYRDKAEELEPRAQASLYFYGVNPKNNTGNSRWDLYQNWQLEYKWQRG